MPDAFRVDPATFFSFDKDTPVDELPIPER